MAAPVVAVIPLRIAALVDESQRAGVLASVIAAGGAAALAANPLFGALSDRTRAAWGRRLPWMLAGGGIGLGGIVLLVAAENVATLVIAWVLTQTAYNAALAAVSALFADSLPERHRAAASGFFTASTFLGTLPALVLVAVFPASAGVIAVTIAAVALGVVIVCGIFVRDRPHEDDTVARPRGARAAFRIAPPRAFVVVWVQRLLMLLSFGLATSFTLYLVLERMHTTQDAAASNAAFATLLGGAALVVASGVAGWWAGRRGNYLPFLLFSCLALAVAAGVRAVADVVPLLWLGALVGGFAMGVFFAVDLALALRTLPTGRSGQYLGMLNITETLPQVVAPLVGAALLGVGGADPVSGAENNYAALYGVAAVLALVSAGALPLLRGVVKRAADVT